MKVINIDKDILGGTPVFNGTRVPIKNLFDYLETGETIDEFVEDFPSVKREQIINLLERGKGDSVKEISRYWDNASIEEVYQRVTAWKNKQQK